jgi:DNA-binding NtrC family response regulator
VRELRNVVERLLLFATDGHVDAALVRSTLPPTGAAPATASSNEPLAARVEAYEREVILAELRRHKFHITNTAKALGLERSHLYKKCQQVGIDLESLRREES